MPAALPSQLLRLMLLGIGRLAEFVHQGPRLSGVLIYAPAKSV